MGPGQFDSISPDTLYLAYIFPHFSPCGRLQPCRTLLTLLNLTSPKVDMKKPIKIRGVRGSKFTLDTLNSRFKIKCSCSCRCNNYTSYAKGGKGNCCYIKQVIVLCFFKQSNFNLNNGRFSLTCTTHRSKSELLPIKDYTHIIQRNGYKLTILKLSFSFLLYGGRVLRHL